MMHCGARESMRAICRGQVCECGVLSLSSAVLGFFFCNMVDWAYEPARGSYGQRRNVSLFLEVGDDLGFGLDRGRGGGGGYSI